MRPLPHRFPFLLHLARWRPGRRTLTALVASLVAGAVVVSTTADAARTTARLGPSIPVWVAVRALDPGDRVDVDDVVVRSWPVAFVPEGAVVADPGGRTVRHPIAAGEVVVDRRVGTAGRAGPAALVPDGWRAITLVPGPTPPPVVAGDRVDVVAAFDPGLDAPEPATVLVADAVVVHVDDEGTPTVAVPAARVPAVAFSLLAGVVTLALTP